jgi:4'-phosphopantetheinyl transferase
VSDAALLRRYEAILSSDERERCSRLRLERARHEYLVAHALLRTSLSRYAGISPDEWRFERNRHGRPEIGGPPTAPALRFNLSHTDGLVVCAVARRGAVGIDVEDRFRPMRILQVARRFFAPPEVEALEALPEAEQRPAFFTFWTLKEAYVKAVGVGLSVGLNSFWFHLDDAGTPFISFADPAADRRRWSFSIFRPTERHVVALAAEQSEGGARRSLLRLAVPLLD